MTYINRRCRPLPTRRRLYWPRGWASGITLELTRPKEYQLNQCGTLVVCASALPLSGRMEHLRAVAHDKQCAFLWAASMWRHSAKHYMRGGLYRDATYSDLAASIENLLPHTVAWAFAAQRRASVATRAAHSRSASSILLFEAGALRRITRTGSIVPYVRAAMRRYPGTRIVLPFSCRSAARRLPSGTRSGTYRFSTGMP